MRVPHIVACPTVFLLSYDPDWQEGAVKPMKTINF